MNVWVVGRDPEAWKDPQEFYAERFFGSCIDFKGQDFELIPSGASRSLPGMLSGQITVELALANLLHLFDWELPLGMAKEDILA